MTKPACGHTAIHDRAFYARTLLDRALWRRPPAGSPRFNRNRALVEAMQRASPFRVPVVSRPLPSYDADSMDLDRFLKVTQNYRHSVVVRGVFRETRAVRRWGADYLNKKLAGRSCTVLAWDDENRGRDWDVGAKLMQLPFDEYFRRMRDEEVYFNSSPEVVTACPELCDELELHRIREAFTEPKSRWDELVYLNFFIGGTHVQSQLHAAPAGNFFMQICGRKRWTLMEPQYSTLIHPVTKPPYQYFRSAYGGYKSLEKEGYRDDNVLIRLPRYEVTLEPGDMLYNAPWFWHEVENLDPFTVGCAVRHIPRPFRKAPTWKNHRGLTINSAYPWARLATAAHYAFQRVTGSRKAMRDLLHPFHAGVMKRTLKSKAP